MTKETMTVHKALAEIKILKDRIQNEIYNSVFVSCKKNSQSKISGMDIDVYEKVITGCYDKDIDLMNRLEALQRAVMLSNAVTKVKIKIGENEEERTVAEAINMKNNSMMFKKQMLDRMQQQLLQSQAKTNKENETLENKSENYVTGLFGQ